MNTVRSTPYCVTAGLMRARRKVGPDARFESSKLLLLSQTDSRNRFSPVERVPSFYPFASGAKRTPTSTSPDDHINLCVEFISPSTYGLPVQSTSAPDCGLHRK